MSEKETNGSVRKEQFGNDQDSENMQKKDPESDQSAYQDDAGDQEHAGEKGTDKPPASEKPREELHSETPEMPIEQDDVVDKGQQPDESPEPEKKSMEEESDSSEEDKEAKPAKESDDEHSDEKHGSVETEETQEEQEDNGEDEVSEEKAPRPEREEIDYSKLSREDLVKVLKDLIDQQQVVEIRKDVEAIKSSFYRKLKTENEAIKQKFLDEGGQIQDFKIEEHPEEKELKELLNKFRNLKQEMSKQLEEEKETNLKRKYDIIEGIKDLVNSQESLNKTFHDFRELQNQWREVGPVPQSAVKNLWESYHYQVEAFYDYIKINKELRDLDFKKNLEAKIKLCERAEELLLEPSVVEAFRRLQKLHEQWRELGPVPIDKRSEIWERFKEATTKINRKHQEYFVNLKQEQKKNYEEKLVLCEKAEALAAEEPQNHKEWEEKSREMIELQKVWKTIGFAPKKYNNQIYDRFRKACDQFFNQKREHYSQNREEQQNNLQLKTELCIQAEALKDNTDWKKTTNEFKALQKKWKEIGPVPQKQSEKIWKRFRAACDVFFNNKSEFYSNIDSRYEENLDLKNKLIGEIDSFKLTDDTESNLRMLKEFQRRWSEIGFVPLKNKNEIQERYRESINNKFDKLKLDENRKSLIKFRGRVENLQSKPNADMRMRNEREKCFNKLKQLENDITVWENNIGFFANTDGAESMIRDVNQKIEGAKKKIELLKNKIRLLDEYDD